jgi:inward rectifier potassium channel
MDSKDPIEPRPFPSTEALKSAIDGSRRSGVVAIGRPRRWLTDSYVRLMGMKWSQLVLLFVTCFIGFNVVFAILYSAEPGCLGNSATGGEVTPIDSFFFSVQTVATIGYGVLFPKTPYANILVTIEIMGGVIGFAMGNGLMFARFSRPTARIMFSKVAVIAPHNGTPTLMFRAANQRHNLILEAHVRVAVTRNETTIEGRRMRRFRDLAVERRDNLTFLLSWTVIHPIDELSPLYDMSPEAMAASDMTIVVVMNGTDESFAQPVYARYTYTAKDILWDRQFVDIISAAADGRPQIDYTKFHAVEEST